MTTALEGGEGSASRPGRSLTPEKTRYPLYRSLGGPQGPVWTDAENLTATGIRSPDRPARSQSLYRLSYPAHISKCSSTYLTVTFIKLFPSWLYRDSSDIKNGYSKQEMCQPTQTHWVATPLGHGTLGRPRRAQM